MKWKKPVSFTFPNPFPGKHYQLVEGYAYQIAFVRLDPRFPAQHPFVVIDELLALTGAQLGRQRYVMRSNITHH